MTEPTYSSLPSGRSCRDEGGRCDKPSHPPHTCPFAEDINDDHTTLCGCCPDCEHECAMDI